MLSVFAPNVIVVPTTPVNAPMVFVPPPAEILNVPEVMFRELPFPRVESAPDKAKVLPPLIVVVPV